ncbi:hypothetical protein [Archangium gephyra]|uniref:hypothetical protein n=1 Tax=Archangium gephyra TaxID=48 RepID=UPI0011C19376|nr:hypothetical protein [Archangium gephyra]
MSPHLVSREHAQGLITRFRETTAAPGAVYAQSLARSAFDALLAQPGAAGIRIYYGKYADGRPTVVLYAYDKDGRDLPLLSANRTSNCPPFCPGTEVPEETLWGTPATAAQGPAAVSPHLVSREHAQELIARFRATAEPGAVRAQSLARSAFDALLAQPGAVGIRIYYGRYADGRETVVLYAYDKDGRDFTLMPMNESIRCPPVCPDTEELESAPHED